jgi:hypothetical protein
VLLPPTSGLEKPDFEMACAVQRWVNAQGGSAPEVRSSVAGLDEKPQGSEAGAGIGRPRDLHLGAGPDERGEELQLEKTPDQGVGLAHFAAQWPRPRQPSGDEEVPPQTI